MSSRAKKKNRGRSKGSAPEAPDAPRVKGDWPYEEGPELTKRQERWVEMFFGAIVFFATVGGGTLMIFESWKVSLACGLVAAVVAIVLVRRGDALF